MRFRLFKDQGSDTEYSHHKDPEISGGVEMLIEPGVAVNGVSIALNHIGHGIELDDPLEFIGNDLDIPKNWCRPLKYLQKMLMICKRSLKNTTIAQVA